MHIDKIKQLAGIALIQINNTKNPANETLNAFTRQHKSIGANDRRQLSAIVWGVLRHQARLEYLLPNGSYLDKINLLESGLPDMSSAPKWVQYETPEWLIPHINNSDIELPALLGMPDIIVRANGNREIIKKMLADEGIASDNTKLSPLGLIVQNKVNFNTLNVWKKGLIEVQDEASQLVGLATNIAPNDTVLDYCAGAGGKTLLFAQMMQKKGRIIAHDISSRSLNELVIRATRAHATGMIHTTTNLPRFMQKKPTLSFNHIVIDAPCSGTGTWRRCPDARWRLTPEIFNQLLKKQALILQKAAAFAKPGTYIHYITCSLTMDENYKQVQYFLKKNKNIKLCHHQQFSPHKTHTDALFIATMQCI